MDKLYETQEKLEDLIADASMQETLDFLNADLDGQIDMSNGIKVKCSLEYLAYYLAKNDVVPVVRCKDCCYYKYTTIGEQMECIRQTAYRKPDDFCSRGERKNDNGKL